MALFESLQAANRTKSILLVVTFVLFYTLMIFAMAVVGVVGVVSLRAAWQPAPEVHGVARPEAPGDGALEQGYAAVRPLGTLVAIALGAHVIAVLLAGVAYASGPALILSTSRARFIDKDRDPLLHNLVEEMALAAGVPLPKIYVIDTPSLNAFAVGYRGRSAIVIAQGLRERLTRGQLQGVIAHEIARMENEDLHLMTMVGGLVGMTVLVGHLCRGALEGAREGAAEVAANENPLAALAVLPLLVVGLFSPLILPILIVSPILGRLIQLGVSRERQFLADAEAARLTRYPEALAEALEIMDADPSVFDGATLATSHLFIVPPISRAGPRGGKSGPWWSHPTVEERAKRLRSIGIAL
jgi:heat shock protein HtpX